jgi:hypothetical protein
MSENKFVFRMDDRIIRTDWDAGFVEGRQYGRGKSGGQVGTILCRKYFQILNLRSFILALVSPISFLTHWAALKNVRQIGRPGRYLLQRIV